MQRLRDDYLQGRVPAWLQPTSRGSPWPADPKRSPEQEAAAVAGGAWAVYALMKSGDGGGWTDLPEDAFIHLLRPALAGAWGPAWGPWVRRLAAYVDCFQQLQAALPSLDSCRAQHADVCCPLLWQASVLYDLWMADAERLPIPLPPQQVFCVWVALRSHAEWQRLRAQLCVTYLSHPAVSCALEGGADVHGVWLPCCCMLVLLWAQPATPTHACSLLLPAPCRAWRRCTPPRVPPLSQRRRCGLKSR